MTMTSVLENDLKLTVDRYCELVDAMEHGVTDYQALYSKAKAEQERFIQLKGACKQLPTYPLTELIRTRFKTAHARMRALEQRLKEQGVMLIVPLQRQPAEEIIIVLPTGEERQDVNGTPVVCLPFRYEILFVVSLLFVVVLLIGFHQFGYL